MLKLPIYAGRKRSRPHLKKKPATGDGSKQTNSSKRHRDKLNTELEQLASLLPLPAHVTTCLDKLSVLRLTVSYLRIKAYLSGSLQTWTPQHTSVPEGQLMLEALNGFVLIVKQDGTVLYTSHNIQEHLGYQQSDVINQNVLDFVCTEDRTKFINELLSEQRNHTGVGSEASESILHDAPLPQNAPGSWTHSFLCRMRCLLEASSGFLLVQIQGRLKPLVQTSAEDASPSCLALFAVAVPVCPPSIMEIRTRSTIFRTKTKIDFTPISLDKKGQAVLGWSEADFKNKTGYYYIHQEDLILCAKRHIKIIKNGEDDVSVFRLLTKDNSWIWIRSTARLVYKNSRPDFIICANRVISDAEGEEYLLKRQCDTHFLLDPQSVLYDIADLLGVESSAFIRQVEQEHASRGIPAQAPTSQEADQPRRGSECDCKATVAPPSQPWPFIPPDMSIWELLGHYGLSQDDLELIQSDQHIWGLSSTELPDPLALPLDPPTVLPQLPKSQAPISPLNSSMAYLPDTVAPSPPPCMSAWPGPRFAQNSSPCQSGPPV